MRIAPKSIPASSTAAAQTPNEKQAGASFLSLLLNAQDGVPRDSGSTGTKSDSSDQSNASNSDAKNDAQGVSQTKSTDATSGLKEVTSSVAQSGTSGIDGTGRNQAASSRAESSSSVLSNVAQGSSPHVNPNRKITASAQKSGAPAAAAVQLTQVMSVPTELFQPVSTTLTQNSAQALESFQQFTNSWSSTVGDGSAFLSQPQILNATSTASSLQAQTTLQSAALPIEIQAAASLPSTESKLVAAQGNALQENHSEQPSASQTARTSLLSEAAQFVQTATEQASPLTLRAPQDSDQSVIVQVSQHEDGVPVGQASQQLDGSQTSGTPQSILTPAQSITSTQRLYFAAQQSSTVQSAYGFAVTNSADQNFKSTQAASNGNGKALSSGDQATEPGATSGAQSSATTEQASSAALLESMRAQFGTPVSVATDNSVTATAATKSSPVAPTEAVSSAVEAAILSEPNSSVSSNAFQASTAVPSTNSFPVNAGNSQVGNVRQSKTLGLSGVTNSTTSNSTVKGKATFSSFSSSASSSKTQTSAADDPSTQSDSSQPDAQSPSHSPVAGAVPVAVTSTLQDTALAQAASIAANVANHQSVSSHPSANRVTDLTSGADHSSNIQSSSADTAVTQPSTGINAARLIQSLGQTEMRVGMHSAEFGNISIRTSVSQQQMSAQISVDHNALGAAISEKIPSIQEKLVNDHGVSASIQVNQDGASFSDAQQQSSQREQKPAFQPSPLIQVAAGDQVERSILRAPPSPGEAYRLDIRA